MKTSLITVGITPVWQCSYRMFNGNTDSFMLATALRTRSSVVAGGIPFSASQRIGFGGFSSFFFGAGFFAPPFFPSLSSFDFSFGISLPKVTLIGSLYGIGFTCYTCGTPGIMGRSASRVVKISSKSTMKLSSSNYFRSRKAINFFCYSSISSSSSEATSSS